MAGRFLEQVTQVIRHRIQAARPAPGCYVAIRPDQDDVRDVTRDDVEVRAVGPQRGVARHAPAKLDPVQAAGLPGWPAADTALGCDHAGLLPLFPAITELGLHELVRQAGYLSTRALSSWQSAGAPLLAKCARKARVHHVGSLTDDEGLAFTLGLTALPKATHLGTYSWRVRRDSHQKLLSGLVKALRQAGLATGEAGFNCDFHAIRHHGTDAVLEKHYVPRRSQRTRAVLTFFAQDHASAEMVYANAGLTKADQDRDHRVRRLLDQRHRI